MKALSDDCEQFMCFPPGHIYSSKQGFHFISNTSIWNKKSDVSWLIHILVDTLTNFKLCQIGFNYGFPSLSVFLWEIYCVVSWDKPFLVGGLRRWYNPTWFSELVPSTPYDPLLVRDTFEKVNSGALFSSRSQMSVSLCCFYSCSRCVIFSDEFWSHFENMNAIISLNCRLL